MNSFTIIGIGARRALSKTKIAVISLVFAAVMVLPVFVYSSYREPAPTRPPWRMGDVIVRVIDSGKTLHIGGRGEMMFEDGLRWTNMPWWAVEEDITSMVIESGVTHVELRRNLSALTHIFVDEDNPVYSAVDGVLFNKTKDTLIHYPQAKQGVYVIPESVKVIRIRAFYHCTGLTSATIPKSVTRASYFSDCIGLRSIIIMNPIPPELVGGSGDDKNTSEICLYVPSGSIDAYRADETWGKFSCINDIDSFDTVEKARLSAFGIDGFGENITPISKSGSHNVALYIFVILALSFVVTVFYMLRKNVFKRAVVISAASLFLAAIIVGWWWGGGVKTWYCGKSGSPAFATLKRDGTLVIRGWGSTRDYYFDDCDYYARPPAPWGDIADSITAVVVNKGVKHIGSGLFNISLTANVTSVTLKRADVTVNATCDIKYKSLFSLYDMDGAGIYIWESKIWRKQNNDYPYLRYNLPTAKTGKEMLPPSRDTQTWLSAPALITVTHDMIYLDNEPVVSVNEVSEIPQDDDFIYKFDVELRKRVGYEEYMVWSGVNNSMPPLFHAVILADRNTEFDVLCKILYTLGINSFEVIDFAVMSAADGEVTFIDIGLSPAYGYGESWRHRNKRRAWPGKLDIVRRPKNTVSHN